MNPLIGVVAVLVTALFSGCAVMPEYRVPEGTAVAKLNLMSQSNKWICVSGKRHNLAPDSTGYADIPAGARLTIGSSYYDYVYGGVSTSCNPKSSIIPESGQRYYIDFQIESGRCYAFIFKEDSKTRTGLAFDPTLGQASDCLGM